MTQQELELRDLDREIEATKDRLQMLQERRAKAGTGISQKRSERLLLLREPS